VARPEITGTMQTYLDLHRHAAVRAALTGAPGVALRLMVAHAIAGSPHWMVRREPQATRNPDVQESVETSRGETEFDQRRRAVLALLEMDAERATVCGGRADQCDLVALFLRLLDLPDPALLDVIAIVMGETLASASAAVEAVGQHLGVRMADWWQADPVFFELIRDKEVMLRIVADVAGERVASGNTGEKAKGLKRIVRDCLDGANGREQVTGWVPKWMAFPPSAYTSRGGVGTIAAATRVASARPGLDHPDAAEAATVLALLAPSEQAEPEPLAA
jgi:ParB family chromosome partitioning protein